ncbi:MAG: hypothetical protein R2939_20890 [Kofleriaceae bacterium]
MAMSASALAAVVADLEHAQRVGADEQGAHALWLDGGVGAWRPVKVDAAATTCCSPSTTSRGRRPPMAAPGPASASTRWRRRRSPISSSATPRRWRRAAGASARDGRRGAAGRAARRRPRPGARRRRRSAPAALAAARAGDSFVVDGAPGTGKTQTLVNLVAQSIEAGQACLVASVPAVLRGAGRFEAFGLGAVLALEADVVSRGAQLTSAGAHRRSRVASVGGAGRARRRPAAARGDARRAPPRPARADPARPLDLRRAGPAVRAARRAAHPAAGGDRGRRAVARDLVDPSRRGRALRAVRRRRRRSGGAPVAHCGSAPGSLGTADATTAALDELAGAAWALEVAGAEPGDPGAGPAHHHRRSAWSGSRRWPRSPRARRGQAPSSSITSRAAPRTS